MTEGIKKETKLRVLVVDDHRDGADSLALLLRTLGCDTAVAYSGAQAIVMAEAFQPRLCFMDISMPGMDGRRAAQEIRQSPWGAPITIVALTAESVPGSAELNRRAGMEQTILKPATLPELLQVLSAAR